MRSETQRWPPAAAARPDDEVVARRDGVLLPERTLEVRHRRGQVVGVEERPEISVEHVLRLPREQLVDGGGRPEEVPVRADEQQRLGRVLGHEPQGTIVEGIGQPRALVHQPPGADPSDHVVVVVEHRADRDRHPRVRVVGATQPQLELLRPTREQAGPAVASAS